MRVRTAETGLGRAKTQTCCGAVDWASQYAAVASTAQRAQRHTSAGARLAEDRQRLAALDLEIDTVDGMHTAAFANSERDLKARNIDDRLCAGVGAVGPPDPVSGVRNMVTWCRLACHYEGALG